MKACMKSVAWHGILCKGSEVWCSEMGEKNTLRWFGHIEKKSEKFVKIVYVSEIECPRSRGRPVVR